MSDLQKCELNDSSLDLEGIHKLFELFAVQEEENKENAGDGEHKSNNIVIGAKQQQQLEHDLEQLQRRQGVVYESAQKQVAVLQNLLKAPAPDWHPQPMGKLQQQHQPSVSTPNAYRFKDIYEQKKQQLLVHCLKAERAQRQFHAQPMPNFQQVHQQLANKQVIHRITCPITPNVLKSSRSMEQNRRQKVEQMLDHRKQEELKLQQMHAKTKSVPKYNSNTLMPLKPSNNTRTPSIGPPLEIKPFRLSTELRAEQRKAFNAYAQQALEAKRQEQEGECQRLAREEYQKCRQLATFRARPNPFKCPSSQPQEELTTPIPTPRLQ